MAKKKTSKKASSSRASRKKSGKKSAGKSAKTASAKKSPAKRSGPNKVVAKTSSGTKGNSVDSLLRKYQKERATQETQLGGLRKKIEELEAKTRSFREQISKLTEKEKATQDAIAKLDSMRDTDVANLLEKLGVQIRSDSPRPSDQSEPSNSGEPAADLGKSNHPPTLRLG